MRHITVTPEVIEEACANLRAQLQGAYIGKDKLDVSIPTKITLTDAQKPTVLVSLSADRKMRALVQQCDKEIGWHGTVSYDAESNTYLVEDIFVFPQEITGTTVQSIDEVYGLWLMELEEEDFNKLRLHGHSHVNMGTFPSGVDTTYQETLIDRVNDFYIFVILNKREDYYVCLYDVVNNLMYDKADIFYDTEIVAEDMWAKDQIAKQVKAKTYVTAVTTTDTSDTKLPNGGTLHDFIIANKIFRSDYQKGWQWDYSLKAYVPSTLIVLREYMEEVELTKAGLQRDRRKPGRQKGTTQKKTDKPGEAFKEYQQQKVKDIDKEKEQPWLFCHGDCISCKATKKCPYTYGVNY